MNGLKLDWSKEEIRAFRRALKMSQTDFAIALGVSRQQTISEHERGSRPNSAYRALLGILYDRLGRPPLKEDHVV